MTIRIVCWISVQHTLNNKYPHNEKETSYNPIQERKILVKKRERNKLIGSIKKEGMTIVPLLLYFNNRGIAKISIGIGKGKKKYDKRASIKANEWKINKQRLEKNRKI